MSTITYKWATTTDREDLEKIASDPAYNWPHNATYFDELTHLKRALVAYSNDTPVGYALYQVIWGNTPFFAQVWVNPGHQRRGIATELYKKLESQIVDEGYDSITTSNEAKNEAGIQFVTKMGFKEIDTLQMEHGPELFSLKLL